MTDNTFVRDQSTYELASKPWHNDVKLLSNGNIAAIWGDANNDIQLTILDSNGAELSQAKVNQQNYFGGIRNSKIIELSSGDLLISWQAYYMAGGSIEPIILARSFSSSSISISDEFRISPSGLDSVQNYATLALDNGDFLYVGPTKAVGVRSDYGIYFSIYDDELKNLVLNPEQQFTAYTWTDGVYLDQLRGEGRSSIIGNKKRGFGVITPLKPLSMYQLMYLQAHGLI